MGLAATKMVAGVPQKGHRRCESVM